MSELPPYRPTAEEIRACIPVLEALAQDRLLMIPITDDERKALLMAAGRLSRPTRDEQVRVAKAFRKIDRKERVQHDKDVRAESEIRRARLDEVFQAPPRALPPANVPERELLKPRACYVCKELFTRVHFFYEALCPTCAPFNYEKRFQTARLDGRVALITGARLKIGFHAALMMLRAGARVIVTTRFPHDAAERYAREADYGDWKDRLQVHGLDLRHTPSIELFAKHIEATVPRLDIIINNAAQTVRRPPGFYKHLIERELLAVSDLAPEARPLLSQHQACVSMLEAERKLASGSGRDLRTWASAQARTAAGLLASAQLSLIPYAHDDAEQDQLAFPEGRLDADLQQVDLRGKNTWRLTLAEVSTPEMLEVHLINAVAPFVLCAKLKPLMLRDRTDQKHIVNVSAMEGVFSRHTKTDKHPHTNMAKAALNMMTLTSAPDYAKDGIFMNAVDTGWVTDEDPQPLSQKKQEVHDFQPPLDIVDGAARICDPFFSGLLTGHHAFGKFFKDYKSSEW